MAVETLAIAAVFALIGSAVALQARTPAERYRTITDLQPDDDVSHDPGDETTLRGPVTVSEAADPDHRASDFADEDDEVSQSTREKLAALRDGAAPALWAWRVRRQYDGAGQGTGNRWETVDAGLAVGEFAVDDGWDSVAVDAESLPGAGDTGTRPDAADRDALPDALDGDGVRDPFDSSALFLDEPNVDVPLGRPGPLTRAMERLGLAGENGPLSDWEFSVSVGRKTFTPDHYQATVVRDGDDVVVEGELTETADGPVIRGTDEEPLVLATGDLEAKAERLRSKTRRQAAAGVVLVVVGVAVAALGIL